MIRRLSLTLGFLCASCACLWGAVDYKQIAVTDDATFRALAKPAVAAIRSRTNLSRQQSKAVQDYVLRCAIAPMTVPEAYEKNGARLATYRQRITQALRFGGPAHSVILKTCMDHLAGTPQQPGIVLSDQYSPSSRLNAMLVIAALNQTEAGLTVRQPKPLKAAQAFMANIVASDQYPRYLRIAGLSGLRRHAACGERSQAMLKAVVKITEEDPTDVPSEVIDWQRRLAIETMGLMRHRGFAKYVHPYLANENASLELRCAAAEAMGRLQLDQADGAKSAAQAVVPIGAAALSACNSEIGRINELLQQEDPNAGPAPLPGQEKVDPAVQMIRQKLLDHLNCLSTGIEGVSKFVQEDKDKNLAKEIAQHIDALRKMLTDDAKTMQPAELRTQIATLARPLERIVSKP